MPMPESHRTAGGRSTHPFFLPPSGDIGRGEGSISLSLSVEWMDGRGRRRGRGASPATEEAEAEEVCEHAGIGGELASPSRADGPGQAPASSRVTSRILLLIIEPEMLKRKGLIWPRDFASASWSTEKDAVLCGTIHE